MKNDNNCHHDIISNLPESIKGRILMCMHLKDAARTSVLSRKWRYIWTKLPHLKLDGTMWQGSGDLAFLNFVRRIFHILLSHDGPITNFTLSVPKLQICPEIDKLLFFLSKSDVEELRLQIMSGQYKLPSSFFRCQKLKHIILESCLVHPPSGFIGFSQLLTVELLRVAIGAEQLKSFVACCPLLEQLKLQISSSYDTLEIYAPRLRSFEFQSQVTSVYFKNTPLLAEVVIKLATPGKECFNQGKSNFDELLSSLPDLRVLHLDYHFMKCLFVGGVPTRPSLTAVHLKDLLLVHICLEELKEMSCVLFLIRSSPNLEVLEINLYNSAAAADEIPTPHLLDVEDYSDVKLDQLRVVKLTEFAGTANEIELAKFLLIKSPHLKKMQILAEHDLSIEKNFLTVKEITRLQRSSPSAEIIYK